MQSQIRVLHVGPQTTSRRVEEALGGLPAREFGVRRTANVEVACEIAALAGCDVALAELDGDGAHGMETFLQLSAAGSGVPILSIAPRNAETLALETVRRGAQEYLLTDGLCAEALRRAIVQSIERFGLVKALQHRALFDEMTQLYNRFGFHRLANYRFDLARRSASALRLLYIDIDGLKTVNDCMGHAAGDRLICDVAELLRGTLRKSDLIGRLGGDEFCALLGDDNHDHVTTVRDRIQRAVNAFNAKGVREYAVSVSVGVDLCDFSDRLRHLTLEDCLARADMAMYESKRARRARVARHFLAGRPVILDLRKQPTIGIAAHEPLRAAQ